MKHIEEKDRNVNKIFVGKTMYELTKKETNLLFSYDYELLINLEDLECRVEFGNGLSVHAPLKNGKIEWSREEKIFDPEDILKAVFGVQDELCS